MHSAKTKFKLVVMVIISLVTCNSVFAFNIQTGPVVSGSTVAVVPNPIRTIEDISAADPLQHPELFGLAGVQNHQNISMGQNALFWTPERIHRQNLNFEDFLADLAREKGAANEDEEINQNLETEKETPSLSERFQTDSLKKYSSNSFNETEQANRAAIELINGAIKNVNKATCPNGKCYQTAVRPTSDSDVGICSESNNYLEPQLNDLKDKPYFAKLLTQEQNPVIKPSCMSFVMRYRFAAESTSFRTCGRSDQRAANDVYRPCVTDRYRNLMSNSFSKVMRCTSDYLGKSAMDHDLESIFGMIGVESGFHANSMSPTGAGGTGQFVQGTIAGLNRNGNIQGLASELRNKGPECAELANTALATLMKDSVHESCDRISLYSGNPEKNLLYTIALYKENKKSFAPWMKDRRLSHLSSDQKAELLSRLTTWSHNAGYSQIAASFDAAFDSLRERPSVAEILKRIETLHYPGSHSAKCDGKIHNRSEEIGCYLARVEKTITNSVAQNGGQSCFNKQ